MQESEIAIQRDHLVRYQEVICLIMGAFVIGWILLQIGFAKAFRNWAKSLVYRFNEDSLSVSSCFTLWGFVLHRQEKNIPLTKITDVKLVQGPILNRMNLWILHIQTAGSGQQWPEAKLYALEIPHEVRDQILQAIKNIARENK